MTRKRVRNAIRRLLSPEDVSATRIRVFRRGGRCVATITSRRHGVRMLAASAKTWAHAARQVNARFLRVMP